MAWLVSPLQLCKIKVKHRHVYSTYLYTSMQCMYAHTCSQSGLQLPLDPTLPSCWHLGMQASAVAGTPKQGPVCPRCCIQSPVQTCAGRTGQIAVIAWGVMNVCGNQLLISRPNEEALGSELLRLRLSQPRCSSYFFTNWRDRQDP